MRILIQRWKEDKRSAKVGIGFSSLIRLGCRIMLIRRFKFRLDIDLLLTFALLGALLFETTCDGTRYVQFR